MKKLFVLLLTLLILASSSTVALSAEAPPLEVIVASDLHVTAKSSVGSVRNDTRMAAYPMYSHVRSNGLMWAESEAILIEFLRIAASRKEKYILISGDLSNLGEASGHEAVAAHFEKFEADTGKQIFIVNGNHDSESAVTKAEVEQYYQNFGYNQALARHADSLSYTAELDGKYRLLAIDSCVEDKSAGEINASVLSWIEEQADAAKKDGKHLVAIMHHNLLRHMGGAGMVLAENFMDDRLTNADEVWQTLADLNIKYIFTGHAHANDISAKTSENGNEIFDVETCALSSYPCAYRSVSFSDEAVKIQTEFITGIDLANLPAGYTHEQLKLISGDFPAYARTYLYMSANYMLRSYLLNPAYGLSKLGVDASSGIGQPLADIMPGLYNTLCLPLYNADAGRGESMEGLAGKYGHTLPASKYKDIFEVVGELLSAHVRGDENFPSDSVEVRLVIDCLKLSAIKTLDGLELPLGKGLICRIIEKNFVKLKNNVFGLAFSDDLVSIVKILIAPIIEGVSTDVFAPGDLNVTLPSYTQAATSPPSKGEFLDLLCEVIDYISAFLRSFLTLFGNSLQPSWTIK